MTAAGTCMRHAPRQADLPKAVTGTVSSELTAAIRWRLLKKKRGGGACALCSVRFVIRCLPLLEDVKGG